MATMWEPEYTFRFDDISINTAAPRVYSMVRKIVEILGAKANFIMAVSPAIHNIGGKELESERVFPSIFHTESDYRVFYRPDSIGIPEFVYDIADKHPTRIAGHGLIHVDHRLLPKAVQELSIVMCCAVLKCRMFVPPFHKWNRDTEEICLEHGIELIKYSNDWKHLKYTKFCRSFNKYYLHTHDFTLEEFNNQFPRAVDQTTWVG